MKEIWKPVVGYEGFYEVSSLGSIRNLKYKNILLGGIHIKGYRRICLFAKGISSVLLVHRIVAEAFIPNPENKPCVNHKDCNKTNNKIENLEWVTYRENNIHSINMGNKKYKGEFNPNVKLTKENVNLIRSSKEKGVELSKLYKVSVSTICGIRKGRTWSIDNI